MPALLRCRWIRVDVGAWFEGEIAPFALHAVIFGLKVVRFSSIYEKPIKKARATYGAQNPTCVPLTGFLMAPRARPSLWAGWTAPAGGSLPLKAGRGLCVRCGRALALCALRPTANKLQKFTP